MPDDIQNKSLNQLKEMVNNIIKNIESNNNFENSQDEYKKLIQLNNVIEKKFQTEHKKILLEAKEKIQKIKSKK